MDIAVVGAGTVGTALAVLLARAGHRIAAASGRDATRRRLAEHLPNVPLLPPAEAAAQGELILIGTPDDRISEVCREVAGAAGFRGSQVVAHLSGASGFDVLASAREASARLLCLHPLHTFPNVEAAIRRIPGTAMAVTAEDENTAALGESLATDAGSEPFRVSEQAKPLYHAAAVFASNYLVAVSAVAEELFDRAGISDAVGRLLPLQRATLDNLGEMGAANALTGPAVRGDAGTVARNLEALVGVAPHAVPAYVALARVALELGERRGSLAAGARAGVEQVLDRWT